MGRLRILERRVSHWLGRHLYPRIPGLHLPYDRQLRRGLTLAEARIEIAGLPRPLHGLRVLLISDVHAGPFVSPRTLVETFRRLLATRPDLLLVCGDLVTAGVDDFRRSRQAYSLLRAPLGTFAVLGNHDHYTRDAERLAAEMRDCGIELLHNRWTRVGSDHAVLTLAGVDDLGTGRPDMEAALRGAPSPVVLMSHNPDLFFEAAARGVELMLSGHTHAGQLRIGNRPVLIRQSRYHLDEGRFRCRDTELVVSAGLGVVGGPLRIGCAPQAVLIELV
jgi:predicted MPP superfamily phosphohydrolase